MPNYRTIFIVAETMAIAAACLHIIPFKFDRRPIYVTSESDSYRFRGLRECLIIVVNYHRIQALNHLHDSNTIINISLP